MWYVTQKAEHKSVANILKISQKNKLIDVQCSAGLACQFMYLHAHLMVSNIIQKM